ncbi:MAG: zinc metalloprotease HtpX [Methanosarcinaceae archaeon]|nr:zinc metalloprotease HtpX [Methanosarcinaceae archaeon]
MKRKWEQDRGLQARMLLTMVLLAVVYLFFLAFLSYSGTQPLIMLLFVGFFLAIQYFYSDKMVLWTTGARLVSERDEPKLHELVTRLCALAALPKPNVAVLYSPIPNAFATGRSPKKAVVAVTSGLMQKLSGPELEAVLAHELSHIKNRDMIVLTLASFLSTVAFYIMRYSLFFGYGSRRRDSRGLVLIWLISALVWFLSFFLLRALSRYREFSADRGSAAITGQPSNLASALMKISGIIEKMPSEDLRKVEGMSAFFIIPALSSSSLMQLISTHPPVEKRLKALRKIQTEMG